MGKLIQLFERETEVLKRPDASFDPLAVDLVPSRCRLTYAAWLRGEDVRALLPNSTFYRHRKTLLETAVVDIAEPRATGAVLSIRREVILTPAVVPPGYWPIAA